MTQIHSIAQLQNDELLQQLRVNESARCTTRDSVSTNGRHQCSGMIYCEYRLRHRPGPAPTSRDHFSPLEKRWIEPLGRALARLKRLEYSVRKLSVKLPHLFTERRCVARYHNHHQSKERIKPFVCLFQTFIKVWKKVPIDFFKIKVL